MMKAMNNPLGAAGELMEAAKEGVTDMVASTMPDNYYDQLEMVNKLLMVKNGVDKLTIMKDFRIEVKERKQCSNQEPCKLFQTRYDVKFKYSKEQAFEIRFDAPGCCTGTVNGNFNSYRDILGQEEHQRERMFNINHSRSGCGCCVKWLACAYEPVPVGCCFFYCTNLCCAPKSEMREGESNQLVYTIKYDPLGWGVKIMDGSGQAKWQLKKRCFDGMWDLYYSNGSLVPGFSSKKHWSSGQSCDEQSTFVNDISFPEKEEFSHQDKAAIIFALSKAV